MKQGVMTCKNASALNFLFSDKTCTQNIMGVVLDMYKRLSKICQKLNLQPYHSLKGEDESVTYHEARTNACKNDSVLNFLLNLFSDKACIEDILVLDLHCVQHTVKGLSETQLTACHSLKGEDE